MPEDKKGGLSMILGIGPKEDSESRSDPKRMAAEAMIDAIKKQTPDVELFMSALDDYLGYRMEPEE